MEVCIDFCSHNPFLAQQCTIGSRKQLPPFTPLFIRLCHHILKPQYRPLPPCPLYCALLPRSITLVGSRCLDALFANS